MLAEGRSWGTGLCLPWNGAQGVKDSRIRGRWTPKMDLGQLEGKTKSNHLLMAQTETPGLNS